jgi:hypothetical protein
VRWQAIAVGDSCLFQIRNGEMVTAFPIQTADQFNSRPLLLSSNPARNRQVWSELKYAEGDCHPGDLFVLVTDAIACWFLKQVEAGHFPWQTLRGLNSDDQFASFVAQLRQQNQMRNDDTTLILFSLVPVGTRVPRGQISDVTVFSKKEKV